MLIICDYFRQKLINQKKNVRREFISLQKKYRPLETVKKKKKNQLFRFRNSSFFIYAFFPKMFNVSSEYSFNPIKPELS